jgi:hypothetical protein
MKLTEQKLREIIQEEIKSLKESLKVSRKFKDSDIVFIKVGYMGSDEGHEEKTMKGLGITYKWEHKWETAEFKGKKGNLIKMFDEHWGGYYDNIEPEYAPGETYNIFTKKSQL